MESSLSRNIILCTLIAFAVANPALASTTNGTVVSGGNSGYAWSDQAGWVNFGISNGGVGITDSGITGYAWNDNYGWINMAPTNGGVLVSASGVLSGYAWGSSLGWINFSGVSINSSGKFTGMASGTIAGTLTFDCANCSVVTDYRPSGFRSTNPSVGSVSSNSGGSIGGISVNTEVSVHIDARNAPLVISSGQSGTLEQNISNGQNIVLDIPKDSVSAKTVFVAYEESLISGLNLSLVPANVNLLGSAFYNITARDESGALVHAFPNGITITLPVPKSLQTFSDAGVYWLDESAGLWRKVSGVVFSADNATASFRVNHLTKFGIFRIIPELAKPSAPPVVPETLVPREPFVGPKSAPSVGESGTTTPAQLFDIRLLVDRANVSRVIDLVARVTFDSFGRVPTPVMMNFSILDSAGKEVWKSADTVTVQTEKVFVKRFFDVSTLGSGSYTLKLHTRYNTSVEDDFEAPFTIAPEGTGVNWVPWFIGGLLAFLALLVLAWWLIMRRRSEQAKRGLYTPQA